VRFENRPDIDLHVASYVSLAQSVSIIPFYTFVIITAGLILKETEMSEKPHKVLVIKHGRNSVLAGIPMA
jgi:hypothetical protein